MSTGTWYEGLLPPKERREVESCQMDAQVTLPSHTIRQTGWAHGPQNHSSSVKNRSFGHRRQNQGVGNPWLNT